MRKHRIILMLISFYTLIVFVAAGQNIKFIQSESSGTYKNGEPIKVSVNIDSIKVDSIVVTTQINYSHDIKTQKIKYNGGNQLIFNNSFDKPSSVIINVTAGNETGKTGLVVDKDNFKPQTEYPHDLKRFWKKEKKSLRALPMEVKMVPVKNIENGYLCSDVQINCLGGKPARGYYAKPANAKERSLPIVLIVHAAGVKGSWCLSKPQKALNYAKKGNGAICFDLNAHGMLNGQPQKYYDDLEAGELNGYMYFGIENRDSIYFRGMYLRLIRTLDFLTKQPEWDGKRILVIGESQGGGQSFAAAGLDKRVTAVVATVPAMCDWGRTLTGQKGGWPDPFATKYNKSKMMKSVPYYDVANLIKDSKTTLVVEVGLIDQTCPSSSIYAAINRTKGKKIVFSVPYREHQLKQKDYLALWKETVYRPKMEFIDEFLK